MYTFIGVQCIHIGRVINYWSTLLYRVDVPYIYSYIYSYIYIYIYTIVYYIYELIYL